MATDDTSIEGAWRDEQRLPLADLVQAVAVSADDGQTDDESGNDAGIEQSLTDQAGPATGGGDPDPTSSEGRALRTDFTGRTGPH
jgi:hypothetical protein